MTRPSPRTVLRRAAGILAAAGLLAAGPLAVGTPAQAAGPVFVLGGPAVTALHPHPASGPPRTSSFGLTVDHPGPHPDGRSAGYEGEVTYTLDLGGISGVAELSVTEDTGADCEISGATAVCRDDGVHAGPVPVADFGLAAAEGSGNGASGVIRVTGSADGATFVPFSTTVTVGGPDLVMRRLPFERELVPGDVQPAPIAFANHGTEAADGVLLTLKYTRGLEIPERYANCEYHDEEPRDDSAWSTALCSVEGSYEPGALYTLAVPLSVRAGERAYHDTFVYRVDENGTDRRSVRSAGVASARGTGPELTLKKVTTEKVTTPDALGADLEPRDNQQEADFRTENTADFAAVGDRATGSAGESVVAELGFRNDGPAWIGHTRSGGPVATLDVTVPEGAEVTGTPLSCRAVTAEGTYREEQLGAPRYFCDTSRTVRDGAVIVLPFDLRIDEVVPNATGEVRVRDPRAAEPGLPFDPEPTDNTATLVLNGDDSGPPDTGGTSDGSTGGPAPDPAPGTSGGSGGSGTPGASGTSGTPSTAGSTGSTGTSGSASPGAGGGLASTGSVASAVSGVAAVALAAGGVLYATTRHRTRRG